MMLSYEEELATFLYDKMTRNVIKGENMGLLTGNFHVWWKRKTWQNNRKSNIQNSIKSD